jgi:hypothetical protein
MADAGLPLAKVHVKPNFYPGMPPVIPWRERGNYVVSAGRLTPEKGVATLLRAWRLWGPAAPELRLAGDGELRPQLEAMAKGLPVRFLGQLGGAAAQAQIAGARLLVLPSEWFEGFPMVVREAFAFGTPAAVSNLGPLPSIVRHGHSGVVFQAASPESLLQEVRASWEADGCLQRLGLGARREFEEKYTEDANYAALMEIYAAGHGRFACWKAAMKEVVLGYGVEALSIEACADSLFSTVQGADVRRCAWLACLNPHSYAVALDDPTFSRALHAADWLIPDGAGVVLASRLQGGRITERVTGSDVFFGLHRRMTAAGGMSVFFLGATEETLAAIRARMAVDHPKFGLPGRIRRRSSRNIRPRTITR